MPAPPPPPKIFSIKNDRVIIIRGAIAYCQHKLRILKNSQRYTRKSLLTFAVRCFYKSISAPRCLCRMELDRYSWGLPDSTTPHRPPIAVISPHHPYIICFWTLLFYRYHKFYLLHHFTLSYTTRTRDYNVFACALAPC